MRWRYKGLDAITSKREKSEEESVSSKESVSV